MPEPGLLAAGESVPALGRGSEPESGAEPEGGAEPESSAVSESTVRAAEAGDVGGLSRLAARAFPAACPPTLAPADIAEYIATELTEARFAAHLAEHVLLVVDDPTRPGELLGYAMLCLVTPPVPMPGANPIELKRIYADPAAIGTGVGAAMMRASLRRAAELGHASVWLGTNQANKRAIRFYQRFGFEIVGVRTFQVGGTTEADFVLARAVPPG